MKLSSRCIPSSRRRVRFLRRHGPGVAKASKPEMLSFASIAVAVLNRGIRPLLAKWHPRLADYEDARPTGTSRLEHERQWPRAKELREELEKVRGVLVAYASLLADAAGVASLVED